MRSRAHLVVAVTVVLAACAQAGDDIGDVPSARSTSDTDATAPVEASPPVDDRVVTPTSVGGSEASIGGVPEPLLAPLVDEAAARESVEPDSVEVVRAQRVVWNDSSLGCPDGGFMYLPALTDGYWVVVRAGTTEYDFRAALDGEFRLCVGGVQPVEVVPDR